MPFAFEGPLGVNCGHSSIRGYGTSMSALPSTANIHLGTVTSALCHDQARILGAEGFSQRLAGPATQNRELFDRHICHL